MTFGIMGFLGIRLEMGTAIITAISVGIGVDFALHYISRFREEYTHHKDIELSTIKTMSTSGKAIIYDMLSNVLGFSVLTLSDFEPVHNFGWLVSLTMLTVGIGTLIMLSSMFLVFLPKAVIKNNFMYGELSESFS